MWYFGEKPVGEFPDDAIGFVYLITHLETGKKYIGKKLLKFSRKKKRKRVLVESDWRQYWGSCEALKADVAKFGEDAFRREILMLCYSKMQLNYVEAALQFFHGALLRDDFYNGLISVKVRRTASLMKNLTNSEPAPLQFNHEDSILGAMNLVKE